MQIGIISDTHDNWPTLDRVCAYLTDNQISTLIHCGDMCAPLTLGRLLQGYGGEVHTVLGNVDGDPFLMATRFGRDNLHQHGAERAELELGGRNIAVQHYPGLARGLASSGAYDAVFYGHDHTLHQERFHVDERAGTDRASTDLTSADHKSAGREVILANPGTLSAMGKAQTFLIYDTASNELTAIEVAYESVVTIAT
jgi:putative phosphoesterase